MGSDQSNSNSNHDIFTNISRQIVLPPEDNAECLIVVDEPNYKLEDPYYSNQGGSGTCVRHALAKAIVREITGWTKNHISVDTNSIVTSLLNSRRTLGARGARVLDWNNTSAVVQDQFGHIYEYVLHITTTNNHKASHISCVDLRNILPEYKNKKERQGHAMFNEFQDDNYVICRNSWGSYKEKIKIHKNEPSLDLYYVHVKDLIWKGYQDREDIYIFKNFQHNDLGTNWPKQS